MATPLLNRRGAVRF